MSPRANYGQRSSRATVINSPPRRKLIQKEPIRADTRKVAPAQKTGLHSSRLQNMIPPPSAEWYAESSGIMIKKCAFIEAIHRSKIRFPLWLTH